MALPALQEALAHLSVETRKRSESVPRPGDVVSFPMAKIIKIVDEAIRREDARRLLLAEASRVVMTALEAPDGLQADDLDEYANVLVQMKRALHDFSQPLFPHSGKQNSFMWIAEALKSHHSPHPADNDVARRQAQRMEKCAEACETQRVEFVALTARAVALMEEKMAGNEAFNEALVVAIGRRSIERFPLINEYLAK